MGYYDGTIKRKWIEVIEIGPRETYELKRGQRILSQQILHDIVEVKRPLIDEQRSVSPSYRVVVVLECVEYEEKHN